ncbi:hypothetical protein [Amycolatopsis sp. FDAARGOS 1241]|uniref:hypothetical protein n=1 Tax=Amycolatopsis sp. FDAARGOS 1241 TaxID=2778070 RepID=UPI00195118B4|nr:hypothetical protein [Amycolatopsis sp. FDAARGOS 1241]QRP44542.1 hypothetical protein I6J71_35595 [Amycolatopsis sp. FDAARGOS 1241]
MAFDVKRVSWREWLGLGAGLLALGTLFFPWTVLTADTATPDVQDAFATLPHDDVVRSAWHSDFFSWFPPFVLLLAGLAVVLFGQVRKVRTSGLPHLWLVGALGALLLMIIGWATLDWVFDSDQRAFLATAGVVINPGVGRYLGLLFALISIAASILDIRAARTESRQPRRRS